MNKMKAWQGSCGVSMFDGIVSPAYFVFDLTIDNPCFFNYAIRCQHYIHEFGRISKGIRVDQWDLDLQQLKYASFLLPPHEEQDKIVRFLDWKVSQINRLINAKKKQIALLQEQKQTVINSALADIKADTVLCRYICTFQNGISESGDFFTDGFPFVNYGDIYSNVKLPETVNGKAKSNQKQWATYSVREGDIFFTRTSETIDEIGLTSVCFKTIEKAVFSGFVIRMRPKINMIDNTFAKYYFRSKYVREYFIKEMNLVTRASLGQTLLKNLPVLLPPLDIQRDIGEILDIKCEGIERLISSIRREIDLLHEFHTRLIFDGVTGKMDVRGIAVPDYEVVAEAENADIEDAEETEIEEV